MLKFNYANLTPGGALHALGDPVDFKGNTFAPVYSQTVIAYCLDDFVRQFNLPNPNHIKIDVDGIEYKILQGSRNILSHDQFRTLMLEVDEFDEREELDAMLKYLSDMGLKLIKKFRYAEGGETGPASRLYNYLLEKK